MSQLSQILSAIERGDAVAEQLLPLVYRELRMLAAQRLAQEKPGQTLDATALVHEAYVRLVGGGQQWNSRGHFFAAAAEAMRRILVETARRKQRLKHGGARRRVELADAPAPAARDDVLALDEALTRLAVDDPLAARVVELRHFAGLGHESIAAVLGITIYQARQKWTFARREAAAQVGPDGRVSFVHPRPPSAEAVRRRRRADGYVELGDVAPARWANNVCPPRPQPGAGPNASCDALSRKTLADEDYFVKELSHLSWHADRASPELIESRAPAAGANR